MWHHQLHIATFPLRCGEMLHLASAHTKLGAAYITTMFMHKREPYLSQVPTQMEETLKSRMKCDLLSK